MVITDIAIERCERTSETGHVVTADGHKRVRFEISWFHPVVAELHGNAGQVRFDNGHYINIPVVDRDEALEHVELMAEELLRLKVRQDEVMHYFDRLQEGAS